MSIHRHPCLVDPPPPSGGRSSLKSVHHYQSYFPQSSRAWDLDHTSIVQLLIWPAIATNLPPSFTSICCLILGRLQPPSELFVPNLGSEVPHPPSESGCSWPRLLVTKWKKEETAGSCRRQPPTALPNFSMPVTLYPDHT